MTPADRVALVDRIARAVAWTTLDRKAQQRARRRADAIVTELEVAYAQDERILWVLEIPEEDEADTR